MPYDIARALQNPDIIGNALAAGRLGRADGLAAQEAQKTNALASLAGQAYAAAPEQRNALIGQAVGIDPTAGMALDKQLQSNEVDHSKRLGGAARYMVTALQSKNPAQIEGAYQAVRPYLAKLGQKIGKIPPPNWDPSMEPGVYQIVAQTNGDAAQGLPAGFQQFEMTARAAGLAPGTPEYQQAANIALGREGRASNAGIGFQKVTGADGRERIGRSNPRTGAFEVYNEQTGQFEPMGGPQGQVTQSAPSPAITPQSPLMPNAAQAANSYLAQGMSPEQAAARVNADGGGTQRIQLALDPATGQFRDVSDGSAHIPQANPGLAVSRSPEETAAAVESAKQQVGLQYLPEQEAIKTQAAIQQAGGQQAAKAQATRQMDKPQAEYALHDATASLDRLAAEANTIMNHPGLGGITGVRGSIPDVPGTDAANARAELQTLKSQVGFGALQAMRAASKTGGALGSVSEKENELLQSNIAALQTAQSKEQFVASLKKIIDYADGAKSRLRGAFNQTYSGNQLQTTQAVQPGGDSSARPRAVNSMGHAVVWNGSAWVPE